jgi:hypothetical protein
MIRIGVQDRLIMLIGSAGHAMSPVAEITEQQLLIGLHLFVRIPGVCYTLLNGMTVIECLEREELKKQVASEVPMDSILGVHLLRHIW